MVGIKLIKSFVPHPGEYIKDELEARGWAQRDLAYILGCPEQAITMIVSGKRGISADMAKALAKAFDVSDNLFSNLQASYDLSTAKEPDPDIAKRARIQERYPIRDMLKRGWLVDSDVGLLEAQICRFFKLENINSEPMLKHAAKKTAKVEEYDLQPSILQLAWLFRVRQIAESIAVQPYSEKKLRSSLAALRNLMLEPEEARHVTKILNECGVRFIIVEPIPNTKIDGATFWIDKKSPVIGMSLRYDRIDNFWFVLRHEIEHVLNGDAEDGEILDEIHNESSLTDHNISDEERIANEAAANFSVTEDEIDTYIARKSPYLFKELDIVGFAKRLNIHTGIALGRLQRKIGKYDFLKKYLVPIRKYVISSAPTDGWGETFPIDI